jgi:hypothetical protein
MANPAQARRKRFATITTSEGTAGATMARRPELQFYARRGGDSHIERSPLVSPIGGLLHALRQSQVRADTTARRATIARLNRSRWTGSNREVVMRRSPTLVIAAIIVTVACFTVSIAHAQVAVGTFRYDAVAFVVMDNGDVYRSEIANANMTGGHTQGPWVRYLNIFSAGGPPSRVVGVGGEVILTAAGGVYRIGPGYPILDEVSLPPGESFVAFGSRLGTILCYVYAVTNTGSVYRGCGGGWEYAGALPTGPTPAIQPTWGALKSHYR